MRRGLQVTRTPKFISRSSRTKLPAVYSAARARRAPGSPGGVPGARGGVGALPGGRVARVERDALPLPPHRRAPRSAAGPSKRACVLRAKRLWAPGGARAGSGLLQGSLTHEAGVHEPRSRGSSVLCACVFPAACRLMVWLRSCQCRACADTWACSSRRPRHCTADSASCAAARQATAPRCCWWACKSRRPARRHSPRRRPRWHRSTRLPSCPASRAACSTCFYRSAPPMFLL